MQDKAQENVGNEALVEQLRARVSEIEKTNRHLMELQVHNKHTLHAMDTINRIIAPATDLDEMLDQVLSEFLNIFSCDRAWLLFPCDLDAETWHVPKERTRPQWPGALAEGVEVPMDDFTKSVFTQALASPGIVRFDSRNNPIAEHSEVHVKFHVRSQLVMAIYPKIGKPWLMGIHHCENLQTYTDDDCDLFFALCGRVSDGLSSLLHSREAVKIEKNLNAELEQRVNERTQELTEEIARRKQANKAMFAAIKNAEIANRAKSELMANMSHELRTPLNAIIGFSDSISGEIFGPIGNDKYHEYINDIHNSGQHLLELINDILDVSAIEADALELHEETINLSTVIEASVHLIRPLAEKGQVSVSVAVEPEAPLIYADERRVKQVMINLLSNAIKFSPKGEQVSVNVRLTEEGSLTIAVADTGVGMDEEEVDKALSVFGQVDSGLNRKHEGSGLGLPLTKGLVERHGGTLEVKSKKDHGTLIMVTFPKERVARNMSSES